MPGNARASPPMKDYLDLADRTIAIAESRIAQADSAEMQLYAEMGWMLRARFLGLRGDHLGTARAGVNARAHALRCLQLDPQMADAYTGLGLYNYYADTLSPMARLLRFLMRIPGGSKQEGIRQLQIAIDKGDVLRVEARFYLAKNLRTFDLDYARSLEVFSPLTDEFPRNPIFQLHLGRYPGEARARRSRLPPAFAKPSNCHRARRFATGTCGPWPGDRPPLLPESAPTIKPAAAFHGFDCYTSDLY